MKKTLLSILSMMSLAVFSQWQSTPIFFEGQDCITAFGKLFSSQTSFNNLHVSTDEGASFNTSNTGLSGGVKFGLVNAGTLYAFGGNNIYQSTTGNNWTVMTAATATNDVVKAMAVVNGTVLALTNPISGVSSKIFKLSGSNWVLHSSSASLLYTTIKNLNGTLFAGTTATCVLKSTDGGLTFTNASTGIAPLTNFFDKYIVTFGSTSSAIFCSTLGGRVFTSTNGGTSWSLVYTIGNGSSTIGISDFYTTPLNAILMAGDSGVVCSIANGVAGSWVKYNTGLSTVSGNYQTIKLAATANYLIVTDRDGKLMRRALSEFPLSLNENTINNLASNVFPNPATDVVTIKTEALEFETHCEVRLKDILGHEIGTYKMTTGEAKLDLKNYNKGIYTYQVFKSNKAVSSGKLIVN
jgi:hypothetical protein